MGQHFYIFINFPVTNPWIWMKWAFFAGIYEWVQFDADPNETLDSRLKYTEVDTGVGLIERKGTVVPVNVFIFILSIHPPIFICFITHYLMCFLMAPGKNNVGFVEKLKRFFLILFLYFIFRQTNPNPENHWIINIYMKATYTIKAYSVYTWHLNVLWAKSSIKLSL